MSLEKVTNIEGLDHFQDHDLSTDTHPEARIVKFEVRAVEMPYLSNELGQVVFKNKVHITIIKDLGHTVVGPRPIRDVVEFDEKAGTWKIKKLAVQSDIKRFPEEWNAFMRGISAEALGTPLSVLFRHDPVKVENYKIKHIHSIEHLAALTDASIQELGLGARQDMDKAKAYLDRIKQLAPGMALDRKLQEKDEEINALKSQLNDLLAKFSEFVEREDRKEENTSRKRGRPSKKIEESLSNE